MRTNGYHESDCVRLVRDVSGEDPYGNGEIQSVSAGQIGTVIVGSPGRSEFDVEFMVPRSDNGWKNFVLIVQAEDLEPYKESATV